MRWPRWLVYVFPRLAPQGTWHDAVAVTDPARLARLDAIYAETVEWVRARRPDAIIAPHRLVTFRVWPRHLKPPAEFDGLIGKVLVAGVCAGDWYGTLLVRASHVGTEWLLAHEAKHCITGESGHPDWLFPNG